MKNTILHRNRTAAKSIAALLILVLFSLFSFQLNPPVFARDGSPDAFVASEGPDSGSGETTLQSQSGAQSPQAAAASVDVPILMYHRIQGEDDPDGDYLTVYTEEFSRQLDALEAYGFDTISLDEFLGIRDGSIPVPSYRPLIITLDDGYDNLYTNALPAIQAHGMDLTAFILSSFHENPGNITWDQVRALNTAGQHVESHSATHANLLELYATDPNLARAEIVNSKTVIETQVTGHQVKFFAYPYGVFNPAIRLMAEEAGYSAAVGIQRGIENTAGADVWNLKRQEMKPEISVNYDPARPENFFMFLVDSDFAVPDITIQSLTAYDAQGKARDYFMPGETATIIATAANTGSAVKVIGSLEINHTDAATPPAYNYNSHTAGEDVVKQPFQPGAAAPFEYEWSILPASPLGQYYMNFSTHDQYYVLGFGQTGWSKSLQVVARQCHALSLGFVGEGGAPTASPANSVGCPSGQYYPGAIIQVTAHPGTDGRVGGWSGTENDSLTTINNSVLMPPGPHEARVNYASQCYALNLGFSGSGTAPTASPANSAGCSSGQYVSGEVIQLTAYPANGYRVGSWSGTNDDSQLTTTNSVTMPAGPRNVQVSYTLACYPLTLGFSGPGTAPTASPANSASCPGGQYIPGEVIQLTAHPKSGYRASGWSGTNNDSLASNSNTVSMPSGPHTAQATYGPTACFSLVLGFIGPGTTPTATPASSAGCPSGQYVPGEIIQLDAHPNARHHAGRWSGTNNDSLASNSNTVVMPGSSHAVIVYYEPGDSPVAPASHKILIPLVVRQGG
jgi:peptidoglycan/xylan/chitin deacetylase (PgdA/CDA1 family)